MHELAWLLVLASVGETSASAICGLHTSLGVERRLAETDDGVNDARRSTDENGRGSHDVGSNIYTRNWSDCHLIGNFFVNHP
jgi:hypothetical protein